MWKVNWTPEYKRKKEPVLWMSKTDVLVMVFILTPIQIINACWNLPLSKENYTTKSFIQYKVSTVSFSLICQTQYYQFYNAHSVNSLSSSRTAYQIHYTHTE